MTVALGVDFEHITHTPAYRNLDDTSGVSVNLEDVTDRLLRLFESHDVRVTFFVVADLADSHPALVDRIVANGHEIASHTLSHASLPDCSSEALATEVGESKRRLERATSAEITGLRAPTCRISPTVYDALAEHGYEYSSSIMPSVPIPGFYESETTVREPTCMETKLGTVLEIPLSVAPGLRLPISGAWVRLLGRHFFEWSVRWRVQRDLPVVTYVHPWEFADLRDTALPVWTRRRTGEWVVDTYRRILERPYEFVTVGQLASRVDSPPVQRVTPRTE